MRVVVQRVNEAHVIVDHEVVGRIKHGFVVLVGITDSDTDSDISWMVNKIINLRVFSDDKDKMNLSLLEVEGQLLVISQFTLFASTKKGNRPSFLRSSKPNIAIPIYEQFISAFREQGIYPEEGIFGADMKVHLINDGPVTIIVDSKERE
jgi:D-tyrosyl-tRNA(Tyr) deacylase